MKEEYTPDESVADYDARQENEEATATSLGSQTMARELIRRHGLRVATMMVLGAESRRERMELEQKAGKASHIMDCNAKASEFDLDALQKLRKESP